MSIRTDTGPGLEASDLAALYWDFDIPVSEIADLLGCHVGDTP